MADPTVTDPWLTKHGATAAAMAIGAVPPRFYGGGGSILSDDQLRPLVLDYLQRVIGAEQKPSSGVDLLMGTAAGHIYPQYMVELKAQPAMASAVHIRGDADFDLLEACRSDVASVARFARRVDFASYYLAAALDGGKDAEHSRPKIRKGVRIAKAYRSYFGRLAEASFERWHDVRALLVLDWKPAAEVEPLCRAAFSSLCELTPADTQLKWLFVHDEGRARHELVRHIDIVAEQLALTAKLSEDLSSDDEVGVATGEVERLEAIQQNLLDKAGERLSLTEAAERLGITRQAIHKKIKTGAALGLMVGETFVLPAVQLVDGKNGSAVVPHLRDVLSLFADAGAGMWSALQYLIDPDPALGGELPLDRLKAGDVKVVVAATRAFLGLDEG